MSIGDWGHAEGCQRAMSLAPVALTVPTANLANMKSAWTEITTAALPFDVAGLVLNGGIYTNTAGVLIDIGIGPAGSVQVLVPDLPARRLTSANAALGPLHVPVAIPAGSRIWARYQQSAAVALTVAVGMTLLAATWNSPAAGSRIEALGVSAATSLGTVIDPGATINTKSAWIELGASAPFTAAGVLLSVMPVGAIAGATWSVDLGIGPAGSEQIVLPDWLCYGSSGVDTATARAWLPLRIPEGARVAARVACSATTATARNRELALHLIG